MNTKFNRSHATHGKSSTPNDVNAVSPESENKKQGKKPKLWKSIKADIAIMRGTLAQSDIRFGHSSRNKQGASNAIVAPVYADIKKPDEWTTADLDEILRAGDELYRTTIYLMKMKTGMTFNPNCVYPTFYIAFHKVTIFIGSNVITGEIYPQNPELEEVFTTSLTELLNNNNGVILRMGEIYFALWITDNVYYCFCPHDADKVGYLVGLNQGTSFALRIINFSAFKEYLMDIHSGPYSLYSLKIFKKDKIEKSVSKILLQKSHKEEPKIEPPQEVVESEPEPIPKEIKEEKPKRGKKGAKNVKEKPVVKPEEPKDKKEDAFSIPQLQEPSSPEPVFSIDYKNISPDRGILCANTYVKEPERVLHTNIAAGVYLNFFRSNIWTKETMADILKLGKSIFEASSDEGLTENENWQERIFLPIEFSKKFFKVNLEKIIYGEVVPRDSSITCEFKQGVSDFFQSCDLGLVHGPQCVLLWQEAAVYYMFDAKERDGMGRKWTRLLSSGLGDVKNSGGACVTWYRNISDLVEVYISNIQLKHRRDAFRILKVDVLEDKGKEEDFNEWRALNYNKWRILGKTNLCDESSLEDLSRNNKALCVVVVASIFFKLRPLEEWTPDTVDEIIKTGIELYKQSVDISGEMGEEEEEIAKQNFGYSDVKKIAALLDQKIQLLIEECIISGRILGSDDDDESTDLQAGLTTFFKYYATGTIKIRDLHLAVWYHDKFYYLFYPYERTYGKTEACICKEHGSEVFGYAFILRFTDIQYLSKELLNILSLEENDEYCITNIFPSIYKADERPPLYNYSDFTENGAVLWPFKENFHEGHESFLIRADKQTLANCMVALGLAFINRSSQWSKEDLVDILRMGDRLYCNASNRLEECGVKTYTITFDDIHLVIGSNKFSVSRAEVTGMFKHPPSPEEEEMDEPHGIMDEEEEEISLQGEEEEILPDELHTVLTPWQDADTIFGILECDFYKVALWKQEELYFIHDPKANNESGYPSERRIQKGIEAIAQRKKMETEMEGEEEEEEQLRPQVKTVSMEGDKVPVQVVKNQQQHQKEEQTLKTEDYPNDGSAYVAWFYKFDAFVDHLLSKIPEIYHQEMFTLYLITLSNTWVPTGDSNSHNRHNFHQVPDGHMIMRATLSQNEIIFPNRFKQEASNAIVSLAFALISTCDRWNSTILDIILKYGDRLYTRSFNILKEEDPETACLSEKLTIEHIVSGFSIYKIKFEYKIILKSSGGLSVSDYKELRKTIGKIGTIESNIGAVIRLKGYLNIMWRSGNSFYLFDPNETDPSGYIAKNGVASLAKFNGIGALFEFISKKFGCFEGNNTFEAYIIEISHVLPENLISCELRTFGNTDFLSKLTEGKTLFVPIEKDKRLLKGLLPEHKIPTILLCLAAIIHGRLHYIELWTENVFEQILFLAQYLLGKTKCELDKITDVIKVDLEQMIPNLTIDNVLVHVNVQNVIQGPPGPNVEIKNIDFNSALQIYFRECSHAIITINDTSFSLWKECGIFYLFQDHSKINKTGTIVTSTILEEMYELMIKDVDISVSSYWYDIKNCKVTTIPIKEICRPKKRLDCETSKEANAERLCIKTIPSDIIAYCEDCNYWDYITKKAKKSKLHKPRRNKDFKRISDEVEVLSGKNLIETHKLYCDKAKYRASLIASCLVAAGMICIQNPEEWKSNIIDKIIESGTIIYVDTVAAKGTSVLCITDFEKIFYLCKKRLQVIACPAEKFLVDENFSSILTELSAEHNVLYFTVHKESEEEGFLCLALFFEECYSYIFFPGGIGHCSKEQEGQKETACLLRFTDISKLSKQLLTIIKGFTPVMSIGHIVACVK